jgi:hypothetical protein
MLPRDFGCRFAAALMKPAGQDVLQKWPVSKRVNLSGASDEDATLIERIDLVEGLHSPRA